MQDNPYVGPRPFEIEDRDLFFGREQESQGLLSLAISQQIVLFFSPSGAGKSSLINTRLVPGLVDDGFFVYPVGRVKGSERAAEKHIANVFTYNLLNSISRSRSDEIPGYMSLAGYLEDDALQREEGEAKTKRVLIIDQFEELFTSHLEHWQERKGFFEQLRQSLEDDPLLWLILVMREDHVASLEPYASLLPGRLKTRFYMPRMNAGGALEAIRRPSEKAGRTFAPSVAEYLVDNLWQIHTRLSQEKYLGEFIEPVQLQVVCRQLWLNLTGKPVDTISAEDVQELGDIDAALAQFYDGIIQDVARLFQIPELTLRRWFEDELITESGTRSLVYEGTEYTAGIHNSAVLQLANRYLIRAETRPGGTWYELVHDRFIPPIQRSNREWLLRQNPVLQDAYAWERSGRNESRLYRDSQLESALASVDGQSISPLVAAFLKSSQNAQDQQELAQRAATAKRDRTFSVVLGILLIGAAVLTLLFWQQRQKAIENEQLAQAAQMESDQGRATIAANATIQAGQVVALQHSLDQQLLLLEEQKALLANDSEGNSEGAPEARPTTQRPPTVGSVLPGTMTPTPDSVTSTPTRSFPSQSALPTLGVELIETQIAQVNATQTAIAPPPASLWAIFPNMSYAIREQPSDESEVIEYVAGGPRLQVLSSVGGWFEVETPGRRIGWAYGRWLTFEGDRSKLPPGLHYRFTANRNRADLPFVYGQISTTDDVPLLRDPVDLESIIIPLSDGAEVIVLLNVAGDKSYGSGRWYLVDVVRGRKLWTGYLPVESVIERE